MKTAFCILFLLTAHFIYSQKLNIYFNFNEAILYPSDVQRISQLKFSENQIVKLIGYTDTVGDKNYNRNLARKRIDAIKEVLAKKNKSIYSQEIVVGEDLVGSIKDSLKRRVVLMVKTNSPYLFGVPERQVFRINNSKDTTIIGKEGTRINVPANVFDGGRNVELSLSEFYKISDMIASGLTTSSDGHVLETGGMVLLEAFSNNKRIFLKKDKSLEISFSGSPKNDMQIFYGEQQQDNINWKPAVSDTLVEIIITEPAFVIVEENATFMDGDINKFRKFMQSQMKVSKEFAKFVDSKIILQFAVNSGGKVDDVKVLRGINKTLDDYLVYLVSKSPLWVSAMQGSKRVKQQFVMPLVIDKQSISDSFNFNLDMQLAQNYADSVNKLVYRRQVVQNVVSQNINQLGWINCDRFTNRVGAVVLKVNKMNESDKVYLIFHKTKSIIAYQAGIKVPKNEEITIVSVNELDNNFLFGSAKIISSDVAVDLKYEILSQSQLEQELLKLNTIN